MKDSIILYSMPNCPVCRGIKMKLEAKGIAFQESHDIDELIKMGYRGAPVLFVDGEYLAAKQIGEWLAKH